MASKFIPRQIFPHQASLPRSYYLGHHKAGLEKMKSMLSSVDYVVECRDFRLPLTSINPVFEEALGGKRRLIVYTKLDLCTGPSDEKRTVRHLVQENDPNSDVFFVGSKSKLDDVPTILKHIKRNAHARNELVGCRAMIVGMPNVGKSTLINMFRNYAVGKKKALATGDQPGVTRKIGSPIKVASRSYGTHVYMQDTPGVFVPYVRDPEQMLKLALCGCVKDAVISPIILADYLLYHINLNDPDIYRRWAGPTNDIITFLDSFAHSTGILAKGGNPNTELAAMNFIQKWRAGNMGGFLLDNVFQEKQRRLEERRRLQERTVDGEGMLDTESVSNGVGASEGEGKSNTAPVSMTQALKRQRMARKSVNN